MLFSSFAFIAGFMPLALLGYLVCARIGQRAGALWLVAASLGFYAYWKLAFLPLLLISIAFNFGIGVLLDRTAARPRLQSAVFIGGIAGDLLALAYYKYAMALFASIGVASIGGATFTDIVLPLGISFFTFTQIGYLVDVKQGVARNRDPLSYVLFVTFFPHLIAGPILHNREMMPQFADPATYRFSSSNFAVGLTIFFMGLAKKVLLADPLSADVAANFAQAETAGLVVAWWAVIGYSLQLYFDFSGYSDMAIGLARMFNIRFPLNFNSPYKSTTVIEYWQRFHMTLTRFITAYIFNPMLLWVTRLRSARGLDNSKRSYAKVGGFASLLAAPTLITMGLAGVWHGAGLQYLIFGLLHGSYIVVNHAVKVFFPVKKSAAPRPEWARTAVHAAKVLAVYVAALVAFAFFRASSTTAALHVLAGMAGLHGVGGGLPLAVALQLVVLFVIVWFAPNTQQIMNQYEPALGRPIANPYPRLTWRPASPWALACGVVAALGILALGGTTEFLYFQF